MHTLVLVRHGESEWNKQNLFTGWFDSDLSERGVEEAVEAGRMMKERGLEPDVAHTSLQTRAIRTLHLALDQLERLWIPVHKHWRLNERHYGDLQGKNKAQIREEFGDAQLMKWRRSYDVPPPPLDPDDPRHARVDPRYRDLAPDVVPASECLKDVVERMLPYWFDAIVPDLRAGRVVVVSAHGNSLRALLKHLDRIPDDEIAELNVPTGIPMLVELDEELRPTEPDLVARYLDPERARAGAEAVAKQAQQ